MDRRIFLTSAAVFGLGGLVSVGLNFPLLAQEKKIKKIGLALYTVRALMKESVEETLELVAATGYQEIEFSGYYGKTSSEIKKILKNTGLTAPAMHPGLMDVRGDELKKTIENTIAIGHKYIALAGIVPQERTSLDDYKIHAELFNIAGEECKKANLQFAYHNHDFEFDQNGGGDGFDILLDETDPELVQIEMDLYWIKKAKRDPLVYFNRYPGRFPIVHIKDMATDGFFEDPGKGIIDFEQILAHSSKAGIKHFLIEQDEPKDIQKTLVDSFNAVRQFTIG